MWPIAFALPCPRPGMGKQTGYEGIFFTAVKDGLAPDGDALWSRYVLPLHLQRLAGRHAEMGLKLPTEVLRIVEAEGCSRFGHGISFGQQCLCPLHNVFTNGMDGRLARELANEIAKVTGRQEKLLGTIFHGWHTVFLLPVLSVIQVKQLVETPQQVVVMPRNLGMELSFIEP